MDRLHYIKDAIEVMPVCHHKQLLHILNKETSVIFSENNNGVFINLTDLDENIICKLEGYIKYVNKQHVQLMAVENQKNNIKDSFFSTINKKYNIEKEDKEVPLNCNNAE